MSDERQASEHAVELVVALRSALLAGESRVARQELLDYIAALEADRARLDWLEAQIKRDMLTTFGEFDPLSGRWQMVDGSLVDDFRSALDAAALSSSPLAPTQEGE